MENAYQKYKEKLDRIFVEYADLDAIVYLLEDGTKHRRTFSQLHSLITQWAEVLSSHSVKAGDRVAILAPLTLNAIVAGLTLAYTNITAVLLDVSLPKEEINRLLEISDVHALLTTKKMKQDIEEKDIPIFDLEHTGQELSRFKDSAPLAEKQRLDCDKDIISIIFSSGTTSSAKGVMYSYESVLYSCEKLAFSYGLTPRARYFMVLPYNHISGYISATTFLLSADTICMIENLTPTRLQSGFLAFHPHYFGMVPKVYDIIAEKIRDAVHQKGTIMEGIFRFGISVCGYLRKRLGWKIGKYLFKPIYSRALGKEITGLAICGTICKQTTAQLFLAFGLEWANLYATTETNAPITTTGVFDRYPLHSVGKADRFDGIDVVIHQPNAQGIGEVYVKSPLIMKGYFREPALTAAAFDGEYFKTGDLGYIDGNGYLFLVGRSKDIILLHSGKKVSAADIDEFYQHICPNVNVASCGITGAEGFDTVHLFVETYGQSRNGIDEACRRIREQSAAAGSIYQIAAIHEIDRIPLTSVGKVKRFLLKEAAKTETPHQISEEATGDSKESILNTIRNLISSITRAEREITLTSRLKEDLEMDSLSIFELCAELDEKYNLSIESQLHDGITVGELEALLRQAGSESISAIKPVNSYPLAKTQKDIKAHNAFIKVSRILWNIKISGQENIRADEKYIFCPNHESYLDGMWIIGSLSDSVKREICSMAADSLFKHKIFHRGLVMLGGIPVERSGNTAPAMKRAYECLSSGNHSLLIHPEGTRSRSGQLGEFKQGAAKLAIETGLEIIPVCISGAYEIFPPHRKLPRLFDWRHLRRYPLQICFGAPISPEGRTMDDITAEIRMQIITMKPGNSYENRSEL